jgi:hypothetical protein
VELFDRLGSAVAGIIYLAIGVRLVLLGARTRSATEYLLGSAILIWGLYYAFRVISFGLANQPALESQIIFASRITDNLANVVLVLFPFVAFRRGSRWSIWLAGTLIICVIAGFFGSIWVGDPEAVNPLANGWWWIEWFASIGVSIWIGVEGLNHYAATRKHVRLGLCEPLVSHRYLLFGLLGSIWIVLDVVIVGQYIDYWATRTWSPSMDYLVGFFEIAAIATVWLAYFAPAAYQRKINASAIST